MLEAEGKRSSREISSAVASSGLMIMLMPRPLFRFCTSAVYSLLRTRATV